MSEGRRIELKTSLRVYRSVRGLTVDWQHVTSARRHGLQDTRTDRHAWARHWIV